MKVVHSILIAVVILLALNVFFHKEQFTNNCKNSSSASSSVSDSVRSPVETSTEKPVSIDNKFMKQIIPAVLIPNDNNTVVAENYDFPEKEAEFLSESTNIGEWFRSNPALFFNDQRHNTYVPDAESWNERSKDMYITQLNQPVSSAPEPLENADLRNQTYLFN